MRQRPAVCCSPAPLDVGAPLEDEHRLRTSASEQSNGCKAACFARRLLGFCSTSDATRACILAATIRPPSRSNIVSTTHISSKKGGRSNGRSGKACQPSKSRRSGSEPSTVSGKIGSIIVSLRRPKGASIAELCKATGWQAHSVRGALSGAIKKKLGLAVMSEKTDGRRRYRIAG